MNRQPTKVLTLEEGEDLRTSHFSLQNGTNLKFVLGSSLQSEPCAIYTNYPINGGDFEREKYHKLTWIFPFKSKADCGDRYALVQISFPGTFAFYLSKDEGGNISQGYFVVAPTLKTGSGLLALNDIALQTYLSKSLGQFKDWGKRLRVAKESGYNFIHFTPIQKLGDSNSSYSIENQLEINPNFSSNEKHIDFGDVENLVNKMKHEWDVLSLVDVVWNHTANNSKWLQNHPEAVYNLQNSPHLRPAFLIDRAFWHLNQDIEAGKWEYIGLPTYICDENHLERVAQIYWSSIVPSLQIHEFFIANVSKMVTKFKAAFKSDICRHTEKVELEDLKILQDPSYRRFESYIDIEMAVEIFKKKSLEEVDAVREFEDYINQLNEEKKQQLDGYCQAIIYNVIEGIRYHFLAENGPKYRQVTEKTPIITRYFLCRASTMSLPEDEDLMNSNECKYLFAHQGWVMNGDALKDFAAPDSLVYMRRELIAWGDSVKLRYGEKKEDSPYLWERMKKYTEMMARMFHGLRLDNCHSTPIRVAEYLLDAARKVNPDLYVVAELFTNSEAVDNMFVNRLGINSLIRERMSASDAHDLGRHVHRFGGDPVGSFFRSSTSPLVSSMAHALFMDLTHDNQTPMEVRSVYDFLASAALVASSTCAIGSNRGYDELVPHHINVVNEKRLYKAWNADTSYSESCVSLSSGIIHAKRTLNHLHRELRTKGYDQIFVDQVDANVVSVTRHCPRTHESVIIVAHTAFSDPPAEDMPSPRVLEEISFEAMLLRNLDETEFVKNSVWINGLESFHVHLNEHISVERSKICSFVKSVDPEDDHSIEVHFENFPPGSVIAFKVSLNDKAKKAIGQLRSVLNMFPEQSFDLETSCISEVRPIEPIIKDLDLAALNRILYRSQPEEVDDGHGGGAYVIPNYGPLTYCGLQGFESVLSVVRASNDLGHPICDNLRAGNWMFEYVANRMKHNHLTRQLGLWMGSVVGFLRNLPRFLVPCYFDAVICALYTKLVYQACSKMSSFVQNGSTFIQCLALGSVQLCGLTNSASLPRLPSNTDNEKEVLTMAAGLPHFAIGMWRCWGRDTFISLRGMLLVTGRFSEAKRLILSFGGCLRHGLIPNLLNKGSNARYNCRDAPWWWLQAIQDYCKMAPERDGLLHEKVYRMYPGDSSPVIANDAPIQPLYEIIQEVLQKHVDGISFRERNAGKSLDSNMKDEGFQVSAGINSDTGFPFGGNAWNCGTWMDKVGGSHLSGNWGHPATPRDGSAVEIVGLCKSAVTWLNTLHGQGKYPYDGVHTRDSKLTFEAWSIKIQNSFEELFWIGVEPNEKIEGESYKLIHRRGIYKDCYGSSQAYADFQMRPNFPIAMAVAPELFDKNHALQALNMVEKHLLGPLGLKTLDPRDWVYDGYYENDLDSTVFKKALGFNYHQGPEWVWICGPFLRAKLHFGKMVYDKTEFAACVADVRSILARHKEEIMTSPWRGLPELTNKDGSFCQHGCPTQAWSMACILEVLFDLEAILEN
eukprot:gene4976-21320_t